MMTKRTLIFLTMLAAAAVVRGGEGGNVNLEVTVNAPQEQVWDAWTTEQGVKSFFAPGARIDLRPGGWYEIYFDPSAPEGHRGADGNRVMLVQKPSVLAFTWNAPEKFPGARDQHTHVMLHFYPLSTTSTRVVLTQDGFGEGEEWDQVRTYFTKAWGDFVLPSLVKRFEGKVSDPVTSDK